MFFPTGFQEVITIDKPKDTFRLHYVTAQTGVGPKTPANTEVFVARP